jgi:putative MATE family efflux protein
MPHPRLGLPDLGFGVGLRNVHLADILAHGPRVDGFEIISETYIDHHGYSHDALLRLREHTPIVMHGVSLSIGSSDPLNMAYLHKLRALADEFLMITGATILCTAVVVPLESALRSVGNAAAPTRIGIIAIIANVILNYALIFGHFGAEAMGVAGSAWGTTLSRLLQTALLLAYVWRAEPRLIPRKQDWLAAFRRKEVVRFTLIALPLLLHDGLWAFGMLLYGFLYAHLGTDALAIMTTLGTLESILISLFFGLAVACSTLLGHRLGAEEYDEAWQHSQLFLLLAPVGALLVGTAVWLMQGRLLQWVGNLPGELMTEAGQVLAIMCLGMLLKVFNMVGIVGVLRSGRDVNYSIFIDIVGMWCIGLPLAWVAVSLLGWPLSWVVAVVLLEELSKVLLVQRRIRQRRWLRNLVLG